MEKLFFNTGRKYAANGQPIAATYDAETGRIVFVDFARMIDGVLHLGGRDIFTPEMVLAEYDRGRYEMPLSIDRPALAAARAFVEGDI